MRETFETFEFESGDVLREVPVEYQRWGTLNADRDNVLLVCHALTGSADISDWWGGMLGPGRALDTDRYCVMAVNVPGSCYGTVGPTTTNPDTGEPYGPDFPVPTIRDMVALQKKLLDRLNVQGLEAVIGGSLGGMQVLEWAFMDGFVKRLIPMGVGGRHSAWCIGWSEAQRQAIYADPKWQDGRYDPEDPPAAGLASARMAAMLTYRSRASMEQRFGRERMESTESLDVPGTPPNAGSGSGPAEHADQPFAVQSYLRYKGQKLVERFDANCYVRLTQAMDSHDLARGRGPYEEVLASIDQPTLVVGIDTDVLYPLEEQEELARHIPNADLAVLESPHGHDAFLIETDELSTIVREWIEQEASCPA